MTNVRPPAVAGRFYPGDAHELRRMLLECLNAARSHDWIHPKALIVPHAGYIYSGPVAASAYAMLEPLRDSITRVILLGPVHHVWVPGLALPDAAAFDTPLGRVPLDEEAIARISDLPQVETSSVAHAQEHSLEVHLPFLQCALRSFSLVPLVVGSACAEDVAQVLDRLWGDVETLIVVSSDLSHFLPYPVAERIDQATAQSILRMENHLVGEQACGAHPINGLLLAAKRRGLKIELVDLRNSGDTAGDRSQVVGYGAFVLSEPRHETA